MDLLWPGFLLLLLLIPLLVAAYIWVLRRRRRFVVRYSSLSLVREALPHQSRWRRHLPFALFLLALSQSDHRPDAARLHHQCAGRADGHPLDHRRFTQHVFHRYFTQPPGGRRGRRPVFHRAAASHHADRHRGIFWLCRGDPAAHHGHGSAASRD